MVRKILGFERSHCLGSAEIDGEGSLFDARMETCPFTIEPGAEAEIVINNG